MVGRKRTVITSLIWKFMERMGSQGIQFIIQLVLARLLLPEDYGAIALITVFISVANVFVQSGFNTALIQSSDVEDEDYSSVFVVSLFAAVIIYLILFFSAGAIADFYGMDILKSVIRILGLILFAGALNSVQIAKLSREFQFRKIFIGSLGAGILSGLLGILIAYLGGGIWALVVQQLGNQIFVCIILAFVIDWRLKWICNLKRVKVFFRFGYKLLLSNLIDVIYNNLYSLVIGKVYSQKDLGYYNRADQFPNILITNLNGAIQSVMLPALAREKEEIATVKNMVRRSMVTSSFIICPIMAGLAACAEPIIVLLLTDKWLPCVPIIQILCLSYVFWPIHTANLQAVNALGRSDIFLKLELIKKALGIICLVLSIPFGVMMMAFSKVVVSVLSTIINVWPNKKILQYGLAEQVKDILPSFIIASIMGMAVWGLGQILMVPLIVKLVIQVLVGAGVYLGAAAVFRLECFYYILDIVRSMLTNRKD